MSEGRSTTCQWSLSHRPDSDTTYRRYLLIIEVVVLSYNIESVGLNITALSNKRRSLETIDCTPGQEAIVLGR